MDRTRLRHIEITLAEDISDEEADAFFERAIEACGCDDPEGKDCLLTAGSMTAYYYDDNGIPFNQPEGGLPTFTLDLDDHDHQKLIEIGLDDTEVCGDLISIEDASARKNWITTCLQPPNHEPSPHGGPITW